jgi:hypothetical protein
VDVEDADVGVVGVIRLGWLVVAGVVDLDGAVIAGRRILGTDKRRVAEEAPCRDEKDC